MLKSSLLVWFLLLLLPEAMAAQKPAVAVMPVASTSLTKSKVSILDNLVTGAVSDLGLYRVLSAGDINSMLGLEKMKDALGCNDITCAAEIGGALGVDVLLITTADVLGDSLILTSTVLDIRRAEALVRKRLRIDNNENHYYDAIEELVVLSFGAGHSKNLTGHGTALLLDKQGGGRIEVRADGQGRIFLDGVDTGKIAPAVLAGVPLGVHTIRVEGSGTRGSATVNVEAGGLHRLHVQWEEDVFGILRVDADIPGAIVWIDDEEIGDVPQLLTDVATGRHSVRVEAMGYLTEDRQVEVTAGGPVELQLNMTPRKLFATAGGVLYRETRKTNDLWLALEQRWQHSPLFALRLRLGPNWSRYGDSNYFRSDPVLSFGLYEEVQFPLAEKEPRRGVTRFPAALALAVGVEGVPFTSSGNRPGVVGELGLRLLWFSLTASVGAEYRDTSRSSTFFFQWGAAALCNFAY